MPCTVPRYVTSVARRNSSGVVSENGANTVAMASFTHTSIGPAAARPRSAAAST